MSEVAQIRIEKHTALVGAVITKIEGGKGDEELVLRVAGRNRACRIFHVSDCCEKVYLADVVGDLKDLVGSPVLDAESVSASQAIPFTDPAEEAAWRLGEKRYQEELDGADSYTWTFVRISTAKGTVSLRWLGVSNGYYSEDVTVAFD